MDRKHNDPSHSQREGRYREIRAATAALGAIPPGATETACFLLNEAKASFDRAVSNVTALEAKATVVLGIIVAAATALGLFGGRSRSGLFATPLLAVAAILIVVALVMILTVLGAKNVPSPNLLSFLSPAIVRRDHRIALALALAEHYATARAVVQADRRRAARLLLIAYSALSAAAVVALLNAAMTLYGGAERRVTSWPAHRTATNALAKPAKSHSTTRGRAMPPPQ